MSTRWDLAVYNQHDKLMLAVEVKTRLNTSTHWVIKFYHNIFSNTTPTTIPYFLMTFPDTFYLWVHDGKPRDTDGPTLEINPQLLLQPYFEQSGVTPEQISGASFELIIAAWLNAVMQSREQDKASKPTDQWLYDTGLHSALAGGTIEYEVVA